MKLSMWKLLITVLIIATEFVNGRDRGRRLFSIRSSGGSRSGSEDGGVVTSSRSVLDPFLDLSWPGAGLSEALRLLDSSLSLGEGVLTEAGPLLQWARQSVLMPVDTEETDKGYNLFVDLPGVEKDDIEVLTKDKELTITATKNSPYQANSSKDNKDGKSSTVNSVKHIERFSGQMTRVMTLPDNINIEEISAEFTNGVLHLQLPKLISEKQTVKKLSIK